MPVVLLTATPLATPVAEHDALRALATAVAAALDLPPAGVVVSFVRATAVVTGGGTTSGWPVALLHGRRRDTTAMAAAEAAARSALAAAWGCPTDDVWVQWCLLAEPAP